MKQSSPIIIKYMCMKDCLLSVHQTNTYTEGSYFPKIDKISSDTVSVIPDCILTLPEGLEEIQEFINDIICYFFVLKQPYLNSFPFCSVNLIFTALREAGLNLIIGSRDIINKCYEFISTFSLELSLVVSNDSGLSYRLRCKPDNRKINRMSYSVYNLHIFSYCRKSNHDLTRSFSHLFHACGLSIIYYFTETCPCRYLVHVPVRCLTDTLADAPGRSLADALPIRVSA